MYLISVRYSLGFHSNVFSDLFIYWHLVIDKNMQIDYDYWCCCRSYIVVNS